MDRLEKADLLEQAKNVLDAKEKTTVFDVMMAINKRDYLLTQQQRKEEFERQEKEELRKLKEIQNEIRKMKEDEIKPLSNLLECSFCMSVGDLKRELMEYLGIDEEDVEVNVRVSSSKHAISDQVLLTTTLNVNHLSVRLSFNYLMDLIAPQADNRSLISFSEVLEDRTMRVPLEEFENCMIRIPFKSFLYPTDYKDNGESYVITHPRVFDGCLISWLTKQRTLNRQFQKRNQPKD